ncbi:MAG: flagellar basal body P-ring formation chaperone FlgA [Pseudomonadota bacterium]
MGVFRLGVLALGLWAAPAMADPSGGLLPVPALQIERGQTIVAAMLSEKHFYYDPDRPLSVITDPRDALGKTARRRLSAGEPIPKNSFRRLELVRRGRPAEARFRAGTLTITATVMPLDDGGTGDLVRARNMDSGRTVTGLVARDGVIEMSLQ